MSRFRMVAFVLMFVVVGMGLHGGALQLLGSGSSTVRDIRDGQPNAVVAVAEPATEAPAVPTVVAQPVPDQLPVTILEPVAPVAAVPVTPVPVPVITANPTTEPLQPLTFVPVPPAEATPQKAALPPAELLQPVSLETAPPPFARANGQVAVAPGAPPIDRIVVPTDVNKPASPPVPAVWKVELEMVEGKTHLTLRHGSDVELHVHCTQITMQAPTGSIQASGDVSVSAAGVKATSQVMSVDWYNNQLVLEGQVQVRSEGDVRCAVLSGERVTLKLEPLVNVSLDKTRDEKVSKTADAIYGPPSARIVAEKLMPTVTTRAE